MRVKARVKYATVDGDVHTDTIDLETADLIFLLGDLQRVEVYRAIVRNGCEILQICIDFEKAPLFCTPAATPPAAQDRPWIPPYEYFPPAGQDRKRTPRYEYDHILLQSHFDHSTNKISTPMEQLNRLGQQGYEIILVKMQEESSSAFFDIFLKKTTWE